MVLPAWQRRGVGSAIIRWALENLRLDTMPVWLNGQPDGYRLYQKFGWRDIENVDIDLSHWAGPNRGCVIVSELHFLQISFLKNARPNLSNESGHRHAAGGT